MALFDDRRFLLSHINHSFITGDDTGICEMVMLDEEVFENQHQRCLKLEGQSSLPEHRLDPAAYDLNYESELFESEQSQSYDIASDLDYVCHRRRSNTAQRLDKLKREKINQSQTKTIVWRCDSPNEDGADSDNGILTDSPPSRLAEIRETLDNKQNNQLHKKTEQANGTTIATLSDPDKASTSHKKVQHSCSAAVAADASMKSKSPPEKSGLTRLLEKFPAVPENPFNEYAQFDGGMSEVVPVKKIMIFIVLNQESTNIKQTTGNLHHDQDHNEPPGVQPQYQLGSTNTTNQSQSTSNGQIRMIVSSPTPPQPSTSNSQTASTQSNPHMLASNNEHQQQPQTHKLPQQHQHQPLTSSIQQLSQTANPSGAKPLQIVVVSTARVQDLIGLICWQYANEAREPKLQPDINRYCLRIAEDNGEVDPDFPSLNPREPLSKFNFPSLALTDKSQDRVRNGYTGQYNLPTNSNGGILYNSQVIPSIAYNMMTSTSKMSKPHGRLAALTRIIFKDAKLDTNLQ